MLTTGRLSSIVVGLETLRVNPLRTALSTLGIVMGSASLVAVLALSDGLEGFVRTQLARTTDLHAIAVTPLTSRVLDGVRMPRPDTVRIDPAWVREFAEGLPGFGAATLSSFGPAQLGYPGAEGPKAAMVTAVWTLGRAPAETLAAGRVHTPAELEGGAALAVISDTLAAMLAGGGPRTTALDRTISLQGVPFRVIGVRRRLQLGERPMATVPLAHAGDAMTAVAGPRIPTLTVAAEVVEEAGPLRQALEARLAARWPDWKDRIQVSANDSRLRQVVQTMQVVRMVMGAITGISLLVGGIGIMNVLLAAVVERTREIGIRKAVGARRRDVLVQFLSESVAISGAGSLLGLVLGLSGAFAVAAVIRARTEAPLYAALTWPSVMVSALAAVSVGLAFGCYPALRAARLSPIDAIRHE